MADPQQHRRNLLIAIGGIIATLVCVPFFARFSIAALPGADERAIITLAQALPWTLLWLASAWGFGIVVHRLLLPTKSTELSLQLALGIAILLLLDSTLGRLGLLQLGESTGAWVLTAIGVPILSYYFWKWARRSAIRDIPLPPPIIWTLAPLFGVLLLATTWAPGFLWQSEFGGYDVLSYHLELPKEWFTLGHIQPLQHNIYSFFPDFVESAYYHLAILQGNAITASYSAQLLHASFACVSACILFQIARDIVPSGLAIFSSLLFFWTPWILVTSSLAYDEGAVLLALCAGIRVALDQQQSPIRRAIAVGIFSAVACGAKLTSFGFVAIPLFLLLAIHIPRQSLLKATMCYAVVFLILLSPWLLHNWIVSDNPVFPLAISLFSSGHWSAEQIARFNSGHMPGMSILLRLLQAGQQLLWYGFGPNPTTSDPWKPQWGFTPILTVLALIIALLIKRTSRRSLSWLMILSIQFLFWIFFTHIKSRFALPMLVPAVLIVVETVGQLARKHHIYDQFTHPSRRSTVIVVGTIIAALLASIATTLFYVREPAVHEAPSIGLAQIMAGRELSSEMEKALGDVYPAIYLNTQLPRNSRILLVGESAPFYINANIVYNTTWDQSELAQIICEHSDDPHAWVQELKRKGFTHLLVNRTMLRVWNTAGWNDPLLSNEHIDAIVNQLQSNAKVFPNEITLYEFR